MKAILIFAIFVGTSHLYAQKIDTLELKKEIDNLKTFNSKRAYLENIYEKDQLFRGKKSNDSLDFRHLISISYFINEYGYPTQADFGKYSSTPRLIWIHNSYREIDKITFPIILKGFLKGEIQEKELRSYYLRGLYNNKMDDEGFKDIPIKNLFEICEVNLNDTISIRETLGEKTKIDNFNNLEATKETVWKAKDIYKVYELNGKKTEKKYQGDKFKIIHKIDGRIYLLKLYIDNSGEPRELEEISPYKYKYRYQKTDKYYEFYEDKILFRDKVKLIKEYKKY